MFSVEERDSVRERLLRVAEAEPTIVGAAIIGSHAGAESDRWSDIDLALGVEGPLDQAMRGLAEKLYADFGALHHWDVPSPGPSIYRIVLLPGGLEVDLVFTSAADFRPRGPHWRLVFGNGAQMLAATSPTPDNLAGLAWFHALHARASIERRRWWQAEYWISGVRDQVIALACLRLGHPTGYSKGAHLLPAEIADPLKEALVRALDEAELRRALAAAGAALSAELDRTSPSLAARLRPVIAEAAGL